MKTCSKCYESKPLAEFSDIVKRGKPYKVAQCRSCVRTYQKAILDANPERRKEYNHTNSSEISRLEWKERNKDKVTATAKAYREANRDKINARKRELRARKKAATDTN